MFVLVAVSLVLCGTAFGYLLGKGEPSQLGWARQLLGGHAWPSRGRAGQRSVRLGPFDHSLPCFCMHLAQL